MPEFQQPAGESLTEKVRLIRFRMKRERFRFSDEIRLIPRWLFVAAALVYVQALAIAITLNWRGMINGGETWPPGYSQLQGTLLIAAAVTGTAIWLAFLLFLIVYVNRDAKRRGMHSTLWTMLVIGLMPAYFAIGFIIYFLVREPLPYTCPHCAAMVSARYNYCPVCKYNLRPTCPECSREVHDSDHYCPHCGHDLTAPADKEPIVVSSEG